MKGFRTLPYLPTSYFRKHVIDRPKNNHAEKTINTLIEVELVDNRELGELGYCGQREYNSDIAGDCVGKGSEYYKSQW